jgi:hypothetical protein
MPDEDIARLALRTADQLPSQAAGLRRMTVHVPADYAEDLRRFARELCARHRAEPAQTAVKWQALSPSAELMVSPEPSARCAVRDTRAPGADRFRWTVAVLGQLDPVAEGRAESRADARLHAEAAVAAYFADLGELWGGRSGDA